MRVLRGASSVSSTPRPVVTLEATTVRVSVRASSQSVEAITTRAPTLATSVASTCVEINQCVGCGTKP